MILGQRIRLSPNNVQRSWLERCAGTARFTYNWGLNRWKVLYDAGEKPSWQGLNADLNTVKATKFPWMLELPWSIPNTALSNLGTAFRNFFRRIKAGKKPGYPRFKKKRRCRESFTIAGREIKHDGKRLKTPKLGWVRMREPLRFPGRIISTRFTKQASHWYVSVQVELDESWIYPHRCKTQAVVGMDLGVVDLVVLSDGTRIKAPRVLRQFEIRLRMLNKELSRRTKGGKNWQKTKAKLAKLHERIANTRRDVTHKLTARMVRDFRWIGTESLNVKGMLSNHRLAKSVTDAAMSEIGRQLDYKAPLAGSHVVKADRWYPSSKTCSVCGTIRTDFQLSERHWTCGVCKTKHDRDENAAENLKVMAAAYAVTACCQGSTDALRGVKLPLGQESSSYVYQ